LPRCSELFGRSLRRVVLSPIFPGASIRLPAASWNYECNTLHVGAHLAAKKQFPLRGANHREGYQCFGIPATCRIFRPVQSISFLMLPGCSMKLVCFIFRFLSFHVWSSSSCGLHSGVGLPFTFLYGLQFCATSNPPAFAPPESEKSSDACFLCNHQPARASFAKQF
jgi:hypothetical protein